MSIKQVIVGVLFLSFVFSCNKKAENAEVIMPLGLGEEMVTDTLVEPISMVATQEIEGKKFIRKADVNMEVKDVYETTVFVENTLKEMGGFVTSSNYESMVEEEKHYPQSDEKTMLVRKYSSVNKMKVRVPTEKLMDFLKVLNEKSLFLNHRTITAEDVSASIKMTELEKQRTQQHKNKLSQQVNTTKNAEATNDNEREINEQKIQEFNLADELKYSTIEIFIKEPKTKISQIEIPNIKSQENQYKYNFWYDVKEAFIDGFYVFQRFLVFLVEAWLFILAIVLGVFAWRNRYKILKKNK